MESKVKKSHLALWLSLVCAFVLVLPANIFAGITGDTFIKEKVELEKEVKQDGAQMPGKETF